MLGAFTLGMVKDTLEARLRSFAHKEPRVFLPSSIERTLGIAYVPSIQSCDTRVIEEEGVVRKSFPSALSRAPAAGGGALEEVVNSVEVAQLGTFSDELVKNVGFVYLLLLGGGEIRYALRVVGPSTERWFVVNTRRGARSACCCTQLEYRR